LLMAAWPRSCNGAACASLFRLSAVAESEQSRLRRDQTAGGA